MSIRPVVKFFTTNSPCRRNSSCESQFPTTMPRRITEGRAWQVSGMWRAGRNKLPLLSISTSLKDTGPSSRLALGLVQVDPRKLQFKGTGCCTGCAAKTDSIGSAVGADFRRLYPANAKTPTCCPSDDNRTKVTNSVTSARSLWWHVGPYFWPADLTRAAKPIPPRPSGISGRGTLI